MKENKNKLTGAAKCVAAVGLSTLIVGSCALRIASIECHTNHSNNAICPITKLETFLFGVEKGMQHQAADLERFNLRYSDYSVYTSDVSYLPKEEDKSPAIAYNEVKETSEGCEITPYMWGYEDGEYIHTSLEDKVIKSLK